VHRGGRGLSLALVLLTLLALLSVAVQMMDGYLLTPLVDRRSVELPPVLTIAA
jgi:predicted PurR-regulated permease PerM